MISNGKPFPVIAQNIRLILLLVAFTCLSFTLSNHSLGNVSKNIYQRFKSRNSEKKYNMITLRFLGKQAKILSLKLTSEKGLSFASLIDI